MTIVQDRFDEAGNMTNPTTMYPRFIQREVSIQRASEVKTALQEEHGVEEKIREFSDGLKGVSNLEEISSEKAVNSSSTPDVEKNKGREKGRS